MNVEIEEFTKKILEIIGECADKTGVIIYHIHMDIDPKNGNMTGIERRYKMKNSKGLWK